MSKIFFILLVINLLDQLYCLLCIIGFHEYIHTIYSKSRCPMHCNIRTCFL